MKMPHPRRGPRRGRFIHLDGPCHLSLQEPCRRVQTVPEFQGLTCQKFQEPTNFPAIVCGSA
jgi:hypothetical protein